MLGFLLVFGLILQFADGILVDPTTKWTAFLIAVGGVMTMIVVGSQYMAWLSWLLFTRLWLPATGKLPWPIMTFLVDAHRRGVLRQAGAVYRYRHARLRDRLVAGQPNPP